MARYLSIDNVNLAFALERFDPRVHQPQPPGYPFFVLFGRVVNMFVHNAERVFIIISILISGLCLPIAYKLGEKMFSRWAGAAAAILLLVNPVFWHSSLDGPLRPHLALFSLLTGYYCWRCWNGEKDCAVWAAVALGVGSGFRPDLMAFLFPLWLVSAWVGTKSWRAVLKAGIVLSVIVLIWVVALINAMGGFRTFMKVMLDYTVLQSQPGSVVLGSSIVGWLRQINRLMIWNGLAIVTWVWALPFYFRNRDRFPLRSAHGVFFFVWLVPGLIVQALIHVDAPGHTLFSVAALCVLGGYMLSLARARDLVLAAVVGVNVMLFLDFFPLPPNDTNSTERTPSFKNALLFGTFESSIGQVRFLDEVTRLSLKEIREFMPQNRPTIIITTDTYVTRWFMNWRIGRYYLPAETFWVLYEVPRQRIERIRRDKIVDVNETPVRFPISHDARILFLIEPDSEVHKNLASMFKLNGGKYIFYTDITPETPAFTLNDVQFVPSLFGFFPPQVKILKSTP